ncbi:MAG TPA: hypothetical protein VE687_04030, partial [Stellaceae bacterium]|nr:hypothetical protein [Stellaceae bacterium]
DLRRALFFNFAGLAGPEPDPRANSWWRVADQRFFTLSKRKGLPHLPLADLREDGTEIFGAYGRSSPW